ncbi:MAG: VWA-like domain-containing protein [Actinomycetota bacterium]|nr:VWA-like domain-containing protein [Actinomycetota bacterium]
MSAPPRSLGPEDAGRFAAARLLAVRSHPYLATALFALRPVAAHGLGTFAVDRHWRIYVDPAPLRGWEVREVAGVLLHEVAHLVRDHAGRAETLGVRTAPEARRWNLACDLAINDDLDSDGIPLPGNPDRPGSLGLPVGLLEEDYYSRLRSPSERSLLPAGSRPPEVGTPPSSGDGSATAGDGRPTDGDGRPTDGADTPTDAEDPSGCGSGSDGRRRSWELEADDAGAPGIGGAEAAVIRVIVTEALRAAGTQAAGRLRSADPRSAAPVDWRCQLRSALRRCQQRRAGQSDTTYRRPNRRHPDIDGPILPARCEPRLELAVIVDTSGSVSEEQLGAALGQIDEVRRQLRLPWLWVIPCDATPGPPQRVRAAASIALSGGGGTDLRPALELLRRLQPRPDAAVVITDGYTPWPSAPPPGITLVVASTDRPSKIPGANDITIR